MCFENDGKKNKIKPFTSQKYAFAEQLIFKKNDF